MFWYWLETLSLSIGVKERLVDDDVVGELCTLCITGHNNGPLLGDSYPKLGERLNRKKLCLKAIIYTRSTTYVERLDVFSWFLCAIFLNKHAVDMFNEFLFSMGDFGKICLPQPYTTAPLIFLVYWQIFPNFARRGHIGKNSNFDHIFG